MQKMVIVLLVLVLLQPTLPLQQSGRVRHFVCIVHIEFSRETCAQINLTNGLEALESLGTKVDVDRVNFVRIQSSHCEANAFNSVLENIDHNLLFHLATGARCLVYDMGSRDTRWPGEEGLESKKIPRALWWGVEWSRYALSKIWKVDVQKPTLRGYRTERLFQEKLKRLPKPLYKKLKYYRKFDPQKVDLVSVYCEGGTDNDGDDVAYARMVDAWCEAVSISSQDDFALPPGFVEYRSTDYAGIGRSRGADMQ